MVDIQTVCCMCGDVGFPDKLFRCIKCQNRFQHPYCSNYYSEASSPIEVCEWCLSEQKTAARHGGSSRKSIFHSHSEGISKRSEYLGQKIKQNNREVRVERRKNPNGVPSPSSRPATRRYKLLKDVMC